MAKSQVGLTFGYLLGKYPPWIWWQKLPYMSGFRFRAVRLLSWKTAGNGVLHRYLRGLDTKKEATKVSSIPGKEWDLVAFFMISLHEVLHLLCRQALELQRVRPCTCCLLSIVPCEGL